MSFRRYIASSWEISLAFVCLCHWFQLCIHVQQVHSCVQGDMEGVRQQAEQHLAAAHAEARSTIQKAQATAADLQVSNFAHLCRAACIDSWMHCVCVCVCVSVCWQYAHFAVAAVNHVWLLRTLYHDFLIWYLACVSSGFSGWLNPRVHVLHEPGRVSAAYRNKYCLLITSVCMY